MGRPLQEIVISWYVSTYIVKPCSTSARAQRARGAVRGVRLRRADLRGLSRLHGHRIASRCSWANGFPVNFDAPYTARSLQDFWRRWHITLSGGSGLLYARSGDRAPRRRSRGHMITMVLGGLWHGADWTFVVWGALHGTGQVVGHLRRTSRVRRGLPPRRRHLRALAAALPHVQFVSLGWLFFNASSMSNAFQLLGRLVSGWGQPSPLGHAPVVVVIVGMIALQYVPARLVRPRRRALPGRARAPPGGQLGRGPAPPLTTLGPRRVQPFIYYPVLGAPLYDERPGRHLSAPSATVDSARAAPPPHQRPRGSARASCSRARSFCGSSWTRRCCSTTPTTSHRSARARTVALQTSSTHSRTSRGGRCSTCRSPGPTKRSGAPRSAGRGADGADDDLDDAAARHHDDHPAHPARRHPHAPAADACSSATRSARTSTPSLLERLLLAGHDQGLHRDHIDHRGSPASTTSPGSESFEYDVYKDSPRW